MTARHIATLLATLIVTASFSAPALAGGEPKNQWPFNRPVADRVPAQVVHQVGTVDPPIQGEPKNEAPFTNAAPEGASVVLSSSHGFSWIDGAVGAAVGVGAAFAGIGVFVLARTSRRTIAHAH